MTTQIEDLYLFFKQQFQDGTNLLFLHGQELYSKIRKRFCDEDIPPLLEFLQNNSNIVTTLDLSYNQISSEGFKLLIEYLTSTNNNIVELNVQNNNITNVGIDYMCTMGEGLKLKTLKLNGNKFGVESLKNLAILMLKNHYIEELNIAQVDQNLSSLIYFTTILRNDQERHNDTLKTLDLSRPTFTRPSDISDFSHVVGKLLKCNTCLIELHLKNYGFDCHDIESMMVNARYNNTLHLLDLGSNNIGDHGVTYLSNWLLKQPALRGLILCRNILTDHSAKTLSTCVPYTKLTLLDLSYNKLTDIGVVDVLNTLKKARPMRVLRLFGNKIAHSTAKIIERMLISQVLVQENLDIQPYRVDDKLYIARYPGKYKVSRKESVKAHRILDKSKKRLNEPRELMTSGSMHELKRNTCQLCNDSKEEENEKNQKLVQEKVYPKQFVVEKDEEIDKTKIIPIEKKVDLILKSINSCTRTQILNLIHSTPSDWLKRYATTDNSPECEDSYIIFDVSTRSKKFL